VETFGGLGVTMTALEDATTSAPPFGAACASPDDGGALGVCEPGAPDCDGVPEDGVPDESGACVGT
jgi:hypothetical protein